MPIKKFILRINVNKKRRRKEAKVSAGVREIDGLYQGNQRISEGF